MCTRQHAAELRERHGEVVQRTGSRRWIRRNHVLLAANGDGEAQKIGGVVRQSHSALPTASQAVSPKPSCHDGIIATLDDARSRKYAARSSVYSWKSKF